MTAPSPGALHSVLAAGFRRSRGVPLRPTRPLDSRPLLDVGRDHSAAAPTVGRGAILLAGSVVALLLVGAGAGVVSTESQAPAASPGVHVLMTDGSPPLRAGHSNPHDPPAQPGTANVARWTHVNWTNLSQPSEGAATAIDPEVGGLVSFGGMLGTPGNNETWEFHAGSWTKLCGGVRPPYCGPSPPGRSDAGLAYDVASQELILFGGYSEFGYGAYGFSDTWAFHDGLWSNLTNQSRNPGPVSYPSIGYDAAKQYVVLLNGGATWTLSNASWTLRSSTSGPAGVENGPLEYDPDLKGVLAMNWYGTPFLYTGTAWTTPLPAFPTGDDNPLGLTYDTGAQVLRGFTIDYSNYVLSTLALSNGTWINVSATITGPGPAEPFGGFDGALVYDPSDGYTVLYSSMEYGDSSSHDTWILTDPVQAQDLTTVPVTDAGLNVTLVLALAGGSAPYQTSYPDGLPGGCAREAIATNRTAVSCEFSVAGTPYWNVSIRDGVGNELNVTTVEVVHPALVSDGLATNPATTLGRPVDFVVTTTGGTPPYQGLWSFGDGAISTDPNASHNYTSAGTYSASWTATDSVGGVAQDRSTVTVDPLLAVTTSVSRQVADVGMGFAFSTSVTGGTDPDTVNWSFGDGSSTDAADTSHAYAEPGTYLASVVVHDLSGSSTTSRILLRVNPDLNGTAAATGNQTTVDSTVGFVGAVVGGTAPYTYWWQFGDGDWGTGAAVSHAYLYPGVFPAALTINDSVGASMFYPMSITVQSVSNSSGPISTSPGTGTGGAPPGGTHPTPVGNGSLGLPTDIQHVGGSMSSIPVGDAVIYAGVAAVLSLALSSAWSRRGRPPRCRPLYRGLRPLGRRVRNPPPRWRIRGDLTAEPT